MANETNRKQAPKLGMGASIFTALGSALSGVGRGSLGASAEAGSQVAQRSLNRNQQQFDRGQAQLRQERSDARQARSDAMGEERHATSQAQSEFNMEVARQKRMDQIIGNSMTGFKNQATTLGKVYNGQASASGGQLLYIPQKKRDAFADYSRIGQSRTQYNMLKQAYVTSKGSDPIMASHAQKQMGELATRFGWTIKEGATEDGSPLIQPPNMPYMTGTEKSMNNLEAMYVEADKQAYNAMMQAEQTSYTANGGNKTFMYKTLGKNPNIDQNAVLKGGEEYAKALASNPYHYEMSETINTMNEFTKSDKPSDFVASRMVNDLADRGIKYVAQEDGSYLVDVNGMNESFNAYLPKDQQLDIFNSGGKEKFEKLTPELLQQMREGSGIQNVADNIYEKYNVLDKAKEANEAKQFTDKARLVAQTKATIDQKFGTSKQASYLDNFSTEEAGIVGTAFAESINTRTRAGANKAYEKFGAVKDDKGNLISLDDAILANDPQAQEFHKKFIESVFTKDEMERLKRKFFNTKGKKLLAKNKIAQLKAQNEAEIKQKKLDEDFRLLQEREKNATPIADHIIQATDPKKRVGGPSMMGIK